MTPMPQTRPLIPTINKRATANLFILVLALPLTLTTGARAQCTRNCGIPPYCITHPVPNLSVNPSTAEQGQPVVVTSTVRNCVVYPEVITVRVNVTPERACAAFAEAFSVSAYVPRLESRTVSYTFAAPKCSGTYKVTESSSNASGTATKTLTVD